MGKSCDLLESVTSSEKWGLNQRPPQLRLVLVSSITSRGLGVVCGPQELSMSNFCDCITVTALSGAASLHSVNYVLTVSFLQGIRLRSPSAGSQDNVQALASQISDMLAPCLDV